jgi:hypothetical protein
MNDNAGLHYSTLSFAKPTPGGLCLGVARYNTPATKTAPPNPSVGASTGTHSTLLSLSSSLRVKGLTRECYGWWTKAYQLT